MQIHDLLDWQTQLETLRLWKVAGIFRYIGITHYTSGAIDRLVEVMETQNIDFVQMAYWIGERAVEDSSHRLPRNAVSRSSKIAPVKAAISSTRSGEKTYQNGRSKPAATPGGNSS